MVSGLGGFRVRHVAPDYTPSWEIFWSSVYYWIYHSFFFFRGIVLMNYADRSCWRKWRAPSGWKDESGGIDGEGAEKTTRRSVRSEHVSIEIFSDSYLYEPFGFLSFMTGGSGQSRSLGVHARRELHLYKCSNNPLSHLTSAGSSKQGTYGAQFYLTRAQAAFHQSVALHVNSSRTTESRRQYPKSKASPVCSICTRPWSPNGLHPTNPVPGRFTELACLTPH